ncbi:MAG: hypothetical protein WCL34_14180 [Methylococcaceae bacterium]
MQQMETFTTAPPLLNKNAVYVWDALSQIYGSAFVNQFGEKPSAFWSVKLAELTPVAIKNGLELCQRSGSPFAPNLPQFLAYCLPQIVEDVYRLEKATRIRLDAPRNVASLEVRRAEMAKIKTELKMTATPIAGKEELAQRQAAMIQAAELLAKQGETA